MKKFVIYLLTMLMAFSPAAVFADVEAAADQGDAVVVTAETSDAVEVAAEPADAVEAVFGRHVQPGNGRALLRARLCRTS